MSHNHCHDEHSHSGGHDHDHAHDHSDDVTPAIQNHLYNYIDFSAVTCLNETTAGSGRAVMQKTWMYRLRPVPEVVSDADEQLLMHVAFTGQVRLHSIHIVSSPSSSAPQTLHVYVNADDLDFDTVGAATPTQTFHLGQTTGVQDLPVKRRLFSSTRHLALFFEDNFGAPSTALSYVGFKGDWMQLSREPVEVLYEAAARPQDHKVKGKVGAGMGSHGIDGPGPGPGF